MNPNSDMAARDEDGAQLTIGLVLAWLLVSMAACLLAMHVSNESSVKAYLNAAGCTTPPAPGALECRLATPATVVVADSGSAPASIRLSVRGTEQRVDPASGEDRKRLSLLATGDTVQVITWAGAVTEVTTRAGVAHTSADPVTGPLTHVDWEVGVIGSLGVLIGLVVIADPLSRRVRRMPGLGRRGRLEPSPASAGGASLNPLPPAGPAPSSGSL